MCEVAAELCVQYMHDPVHPSRSGLSPLESRLLAESEFLAFSTGELHSSHTANTEN